MWSIGVILFALLCGYLPFEDPNTAQLYRKILSCQYKPAKWISAEARDLISKILEVDPTKRYTPTQIRMHPWYNIVPESSIPRDLAHAASSAEHFRQETLAAVERAGFDVQAVHDAVKSNMCNSLSALYYLFEKSLIHNRAAARSKEAPPALNPGGGAGMGAGGARLQLGASSQGPTQPSAPPTAAVPPLQISHIQQSPRNVKPVSVVSKPVGESPSHHPVNPKSDLGTAKVAAGATPAFASAVPGGQPNKGPDIENVARPPRNPQPPPKVPLRPQLQLSRPSVPATAQPNVPSAAAPSSTNKQQDSCSAEVHSAAVSDPASGQNTQKSDKLPEIERISLTEAAVANFLDVEGNSAVASDAIDIERPVTRRSHLRTPGKMNRPSTVEKGEFDPPVERVKVEENTAMKEPPVSTGAPSLIASDPTVLSADAMSHEVSARAPGAPKSSIPTGGRRGKNIVAPPINTVASNIQSTNLSEPSTNNSSHVDVEDLKGAEEFRSTEQVAVVPDQSSQKPKSKFLNFGARFVSAGGRGLAPSAVVTGSGLMNPKEQAAQNKASAHSGSIGPGAGAVVI
jgi:serine/threonine protein kinase